MIKKTLLTLLLLLVIAGTIAGIKYAQIQQIGTVFSEMSPPTLSVATDSVKVVDWAVEASTIGTITPVQGVTLSVDSPGIIDSIHFESGQTVKKGDLLLTLDTQSEEAELAANIAETELAEINLRRSERLLASQSIPQSEFDTLNARSKQAKADVKNIEAQIAKKKIKAPFDGILGIRRVNLGQFINSETEVVSLQSVDPIYVSFFLPQQNVPLLKKGLSVTVATDAFPERTFRGSVNAMAAEVDPLSRKIEVQAVIPNTDGSLTSGMFVNVTLQKAEPRSALAIPATAIIYASYGNTVYTVVPGEEDSFIAKQNFVKLGETLGDYVEVVSGLQTGDRVVISGGFKLYPFAPVMVNDDRAAVASMYPNPDDN